jgi:hypothetical protein
MQHYEKWKADLQLASAVGVNCIRYSVPWYRSEPSPSTYDWSWIDGPIQYLVNELKIIPVLDIIHYGTPAWMEDGIADDRFSDALSTLILFMSDNGGNYEEIEMPGPNAWKSIFVPQETKDGRPVRRGNDPNSPWCK